MEYLHYHNNISKPSNLSIINAENYLICKYLYMCIVFIIYILRFIYDLYI